MTRDDPPELRLFTAADGYRFAVRAWPQDSSPARVVVLHGIMSHGGWYLLSCRHLARSGFEVHALDRRGSGVNMAARGDVDRCETWLSDVEDYLASLTPALPTVLVGISWGGKLALALAGRNRVGLAGVGLICPGLFARQQANLVQRALLRTAAGAGLSGLRIAIPLRDPALFTDTPSWRTYMRDDPLTLRQITVRLALADLNLNALARTEPQRITLPTLLMLAGRDRIVNNEQTRAFFVCLGSPNKTEIEYPEAAHTLEFEPNPARYLDDLRDWVMRITAGVSGNSASP